MVPGFLSLSTKLLWRMNYKKLEFHLKKKKSQVCYQDVILDIGFRCDFLVDNRVIVECKAVCQLTELDQAQVINYLKIADKPVGLLINFNVKLLKNGLKRFAN